MRLLRLMTLLVLILVISQVAAQSSLEERGYGIYIPTTYDEDNAMPLLIALHGFGDNWENFVRTSGLVQGAETYGYIAVFPNGYLNQWNDGSPGDHYEDDVTILLELVDIMLSNYNIDSGRIYLVGFSNGGSMAYRAACEAPHVFAGIASVSGTMWSELDCEKDAALPVLIIHGTGDSVFPFEGGEGRFSVLETAKFWTTLNDCDTRNTPAYDPKNFSGNVAAYFYENCPDANLILLYLIENYPHTWPGSTAYISNLAPDMRIHSVYIIWAFFEHIHNAKLALEETVDITDMRS